MIEPDEYWDSYEVQRDDNILPPIKKQPMTKLEFYNHLQKLHNKAADAISLARYHYINYNRSGEAIDLELADLQDEAYSNIQMEIIGTITDKAFIQTMEEFPKTVKHEPLPY